VFGRVELAFRELSRDICSDVGSDRDADIGSLVFDLADGARNRGTIDEIARLTQQEPIIANGKAFITDGDDVVATDEPGCEFGPGMIEYLARRPLLLDPATVHQTTTVASAIASS